MADYHTVYIGVLEAIERDMAPTLTEQDSRRWMAKTYPDQFNFEAWLAARRTVRNLIRAELGLEPIVPSGQLTLGNVA